MFLGSSKYTLPVSDSQGLVQYLVVEDTGSPSVVPVPGPVTPTSTTRYCVEFPEPVQGWLRTRTGRHPSPEVTDGITGVEGVCESPNTSRVV